MFILVYVGCLFMMHIGVCMVIGYLHIGVCSVFVCDAYWCMRPGLVCDAYWCMHSELVCNTYWCM